MHFTRHCVSVNTLCRAPVLRYDDDVPKLWRETIEAHREEVIEAILDTTAELVHKKGLAALAMSHIAAHSGVGRATLYKYFPNLEAILQAWHERHVARHLDALDALRAKATTPWARISEVFSAYAQTAFERPSTDLAKLLHRSEHASRARQKLGRIIRELLVEAVEQGQVRSDVPPDELSTFCLHTLEGASQLPSKAAVQRLVDLVLAALRPEKR